MTVQTQGKDAGQASTSQEKASLASSHLMEPRDGDCTLRTTTFEDLQHTYVPGHQEDAAQPPCTPDQPQQTFFGRSDHEHVKAQYNKASMLGLRSLPDALQPHFRERLFAELVAIGQARRHQQRQKMSSNIYASNPHPEMAAALMPLLAHSTKGPPLQTQVHSLTFTSLHSLRVYTHQLTPA